MIRALGPGAAFYDLDGTLVRTNLVHVLLFYARNDRGLLKSLQRTAVSVAGIPLFFAAEREVSRTVREAIERLGPEKERRPPARLRRETEPVEVEP
jgi:phosphoserine phosphatase